MTCVVVLGPHRSGTSLVARILQNAGVRMGERFRESDEFNLEGYCEDLDFKELNQSILKFAKGTWWNPPESLDNICNHYTDQIEKLADARTAKHEVWGFKDPRQALLLDLYRPYLPSDTKYVVVSRNVDDISKSLYKREYIKNRRVGRDFDIEYYKELTQRYYSIIMSYVVDKDHIVVSYSKLTAVEYASFHILNIHRFLYDNYANFDDTKELMIKSLGMIKYENKL